MRALPSLLLACLVGCDAVSSGGFIDGDADAPSDASVSADAPTSIDRPPADVPARADVVTAVDAGPPPPMGDPASRSASEVCARWRSESAPARAAAGWTAGASACEAGTLSPATRSAAVQALNLFRWLAGLGPVGESAMRHEASQACAVLLERNGALSHTPPMTWNCWTPLGYDGTSHGNLIGGRGTRANAWNSIEKLIDDRNDVTRTLGHRRWMLYPLLGDVGYGEATSFACLYVIGGFRGTRARPWVAWPNAGPVPAEAIPPSWSFSAPSLGWQDGSSRVTVTRDGAPVAVTAARRAPNYGDDTVSWDLPAVVPGSVYAIEISGISMGSVRYEVRPVACP
ncbi:MAG: hypothetical protein R3A48_22930 [Polyangiales bacterium]